MKTSKLTFRQSVIDMAIRMGTICLSLATAGLILLPFSANAQTEFAPDKLEDFAVQGIVGELDGVVYRVKVLFANKKGEVLQRTDLGETAQRAIAAHLTSRINWLGQTEDRLEEAESMRDVVRIHQDVEAFMALPLRPPMEKVVGELFTRHQTGLDSSLQLAQEAIGELVEQGENEEEMVPMYTEAEQAVERAYASWDMAKESDNPALWRVAKQDHEVANEAIKGLFSELKNMR